MQAPRRRRTQPRLRRDSTTGGNKGVGRLTRANDEPGSSRFSYDGQGRLTKDAKAIQGKGYDVLYAYDANGKVTQITLPSGRTVTITRAIDGLATGVTTKATPTSAAETLASNIAYAPFGPLSGLDYGNGLQLIREHDQNYWLTRERVKSASVTRLDLSFGRNPNGGLTSVTDNAATGRAASYGYGNAGRVNAASGAWGADSYAFDAAGNRTSKVRTLGGTTTTETAVMASASNRVSQVKDAGGTVIRALTYRTGGDLSQDARTGGPTWDYLYNARDRLKAVRQGGADLATYGYDAFGRRVWRTLIGPPSVSVHYIYDPQGHLLAEHAGATGAALREYVWLDDMPLAVIDASSGTAKTYFIHTGQLNEPLLLTDAAQAKVWDASVEPFGTATVFGTPAAAMDLRLPGQQLQAEGAGLHQNWMRDYDPSLGRYIQPDPLGIEAGQNVYGYVDGRVLELVDPLGLFAVCRYYSEMCRQRGGVYYCYAAPAMCNTFPDSPWAKCVRLCLQTEDKRLCTRNPLRRCAITNGSCLSYIHGECFTGCAKDPASPLPSYSPVR